MLSTVGSTKSLIKYHFIQFWKIVKHRHAKMKVTRARIEFPRTGPPFQTPIIFMFLLLLYRYRWGTPLPDITPVEQKIIDALTANNITKYLDMLTLFEINDEVHFPCPIWGGTQRVSFYP